MISIKIFRNKNKCVCKFEVSGHADYAKKGSDIVCSAVSALVFNAINSIERFTGEAIEVDIGSSGYISCRIPLYESCGLLVPDDKVGLLVDSMVFGLENIQKQYGKYICIFNEEVQTC